LTKINLLPKRNTAEELRSRWSRTDPGQRRGL